MNKKNLLIPIGIFIVLVLSAFSLVLKSNNISVEPENPIITESVSNTPTSKNNTALADKYVVYSPEVFANTANTRRVLFFYANWCPICKPADQDISANEAKIPDDVTVMRVNYNDSETDQNEKDLAKKYGVTYQHTFVQIDSEGNLVTKWNGGKSAELLKNIK